MGDDDDTIFEERARVISGFDASLRPEDTISPRTLAARNAGAPRASEPVADADVQLRQLPRIALDVSIDARGRPSEPPRADRDLAVLSMLGEGGMGRVHLAHQRSLAREVAVKTLRDDAPPAVAQALLREARLTGALEHPGVIPVHALGVDHAERPILVMKRVDGVDLGTLLEERADVAWSSRTGAVEDKLSATLEILVQVCLTVEFAHSRGVIHRDIKPENVMVGGFGEVYLLDWVIATTRNAPDAENDSASPLTGTPAYMAPEMLLGNESDERTDVYLLGATLHHVLTGQSRHVGATVRAVLRAALASEPFTYDPHVPEALASLCNRATARDPTARPASARAFREEILRFKSRRSMQGLCDAALERLRSLDDLLGQAPEGRVPSDLPLAYRLAAEARFGLTQSAQGGAGEAAVEGMERCIAALVELELRQGHADTAEALLREMQLPPESLARRVDAIRERDAARERERARLETLDRDVDPSALALKRTRSILVCSVLVAFIWLAVAIRGRPPTAGWLVAVSLGGNVAVNGLLAWLRRNGGNSFNRRLGGLLALAFAGSFVNRCYAYVFRGVVPSQTLTVDLVVFVVVAAAAAIALLRGMWLIVLVFGCGLVAIRVWPGQSGRIFGLASVGALLTGAGVLARASKAR
jgi:serine/threonine-protein kinase